MDLYLSHGCPVIDKAILHVSPWQVLTTGYLDAWMPMAIKGGKVQLASQIQCRCQYGQTRQKF